MEHSIPEIEARLREIEEWEGKLDAPEDRDITNLPVNLQRFVLNEQRMCFINFEYWATRYGYLVTARKKIERFDPWPSQKFFLKEIAREEEKQWERWLRRKTAREFQFQAGFIWVKARQVGGTRLAQFLCGHLTFLTANTYTLIASDTPEKGLELWRLLDKMYTHLPWWMMPKREGRVKGQEHYFDGIGSTISIGAGNQKASLGQGVTVDTFHCTEVSTWDPSVAEMIDLDLFPAFESSEKNYSLGLIESTAAGGSGNWFAKQWEVSAKGEGYYIPVFLSWYHRPDHFRIPDAEDVISPETEALARRIEERYPDVKLHKDQLAWYQKKRREMEAKGNLAGFLQERPSFPEEAFEYGTQSIFSISTRERVKNTLKAPAKVYKWDGDVKLKPATWDGDPEHANGLLFIWEPYEEGRIYYVGVDGSHGVDGGDSHAIQVVAAPVGDAAAKQVAEWCWNGDGRGPGSLSTVADVAMFFGDLYKDPQGKLACVAPESNPGSPSAYVTLKLREARYPNIYIHRRQLKVRGEQFREEMGWQTNEATRTPLILGGKEGLETGRLRVRSERIMAEMRTFQRTWKDSGKVKFEHAEGKHDDALIALFIAYAVATDEVALWDAEQALRGASRNEALKREAHDKETNKYTITLGVPHPDMEWPDGEEYKGDHWMDQFVSPERRQLY